MAYGRKSLLIVEDEPLISVMIEDMARDLEWEVEGSAQSEQEALRLLDSCQPTVAVLDINLGPTTSLGIAARCRDRGIPVLFITGYAARDATELSEDAPVLCKPFSPEDFSRSLQRCLLAAAAPDGSERALQE